jgi:ribonuclease E
MPAPVAPVPSAPVQAPAPIQAPVQAAAPVAAQADLGEVLAQAGLQLASTDPEKLRAAQEAAAQAQQPVRLGRTRKVAPPPAQEPLVQVDTRQ